MKYTLPKIFQNKYFLYTVTLFAIGNLMGYLANEKYNSLSFFLAVGLLSSYFSKNMSVVLLIAMATTSIFSNNNFIEGFKEGQSPMEDEQNKSPQQMANQAAVNQAAPQQQQGKQQQQQQGQQQQSDGSNVEVVASQQATDGGAAVASMTNTMKTQAEKNSQDAKAENSQQGSAPAAPGGNTGALDEKKDDKQAFTNREGLGVGPARKEICYKEDKGAKGGWKILNSGKHVPEANCGGNDMSWGGSCMAVNKVNPLTGKAEYVYMTDATAQENPEQCSLAKGKWCPLSGCKDGDNFSNMKKKSHTESKAARVDGVDETVGDRIDYANTMKQSMNNLQDMLGTDGMKGLAAETKRLVAQQKELVDSLGQMAPVLHSAKSTLDSLNLPDMKGITNILGVLKGGK